MPDSDPNPETTENAPETHEGHKSKPALNSPLHQHHLRDSHLMQVAFHLYQIKKKSPKEVYWRRFNEQLLSLASHPQPEPNFEPLKPQEDLVCVVDKEVLPLLYELRFVVHAEHKSLSQHLQKVIFRLASAVDRQVLQELGIPEEKWEFPEANEEALPEMPE